MIDVTLSLIADFNLGRWAWEATGFPYISHYACGHYDTFDTVSLLTFGLISALKSIDTAAVAKYLCSYMNEHRTLLEARRDGRKLTVKVRTTNENFVQLLTGTDNGKVPSKLLAELKKETSRFHIEPRRARPEETEKLQGWSKMVLPSRQFVDGFPRPEEQRTA